MLTLLTSPPLTWRSFVFRYQDIIYLLSFLTIYPINAIRFEQRATRLTPAAAASSRRRRRGSKRLTDALHAHCLPTNTDAIQRFTLPFPNGAFFRRLRITLFGSTVSHLVHYHSRFDVSLLLC